ncbi:hypothetical protein BPT24_175 [Tenacibaculum phage pT24]|uniref:Uncharacterized protein n=1 Tax=Tenacibaculum phage pT24 TaxID=1880590 RepID=A0A1B4XWW2_9CAUD|nr:hypothetical protein HYP10_gp175 [Tenacibaculum phage pT24]BAV39301.1 hypothetical protein BPT24_175 [Tenacibaculum phage pT24]
MRQEFETKIIPQDIVVRQSNEEDQNIEENAGLWFPLIRVKDTVFNQDKILSFKYTVGSELLPSVRVTIDDYDKAFLEEQFPMVDDKITIRISNNIDTVHKPIKLDFIITDISGSANSKSTTITAIQDVPKLHIYKNTGWNDSLYNILKKIATECDLGFVTNIQQSNDSANYICHNDYYSFLKYSENRIDVGQDDSCKIFIDAFNNLNLVSYKNAYSNREITRLQTNPVTGLAYDDNIDLKLSNKTYNDETDIHAQINNWTPISNYGKAFLKTKNIVNYRQRSTEKHLQNTFNEFGIQNINSIDNSIDNVFSNFVHEDSTYSNILTNRKNNDRLIQIYKQGTYTRMVMDYFIPDLYPFVYVPVELYNNGRLSKLNSQDSNVDLDELSEQESEYPSNGLSLNNEFTGDYIVTEIKYSYLRSGRSDSNQVKNELLAIKV